MNAPCKGCPERRYPYCYDTCERYQEYRAKLEDIRRQMRHETRVTEVLRNGSLRGRKEKSMYKRLRGRE